MIDGTEYRGGARRLVWPTLAKDDPGKCSHVTPAEQANTGENGLEAHGYQGEGGRVYMVPRLFANRLLDRL